MYDKKDYDLYNKKVIIKKEENLYIRSYKNRDKYLRNRDTKNFGVWNRGDISPGEDNSTLLMY